MALDTSSFGGGPLGLDIGPPLPYRQRKAAASFILGQILALADLRGLACRRRGQSEIRRPASGRPAAASKGLTAIAQLRISAAKRRAEDEADAATPAAPKRAAVEPRLRVAATAEVSIVGRKPIVIVPPGSAAVPVNPSQLGCHLARRCGGGSHQGVGAAAGSMARVYGSRLRTALLPEDYTECFVGLDPEAEPELQGGLQQHVSIGAPADPTAAVLNAGELLGATSMGATLSFPFAVPVDPSDAAQAVGLVGVGLAPGGLNTPFLPGNGAFGGLPYNGGLAYGSLADPGGATGAAPKATADLMLDPEDAMSSDSDDGGVGEDRIGGVDLLDGGPVGTAGVLGPRHQGYFQPGPGQIYVPGPSGGVGAGPGEVQIGACVASVLAGGGAAEGQGAFGAGSGGTTAGMEDDGMMVEEF